MVNKALNESLDMHIERNKSSMTSVAVKSDVPKRSFFKRLKEYFFPSDEYEHATFSSDALTVVKRVDKGFKRHWRQFLALFKKKEE